MKLGSAGFGGVCDSLDGARKLLFGASTSWSLLRRWSESGQEVGRYTATEAGGGVGGDLINDVLVEQARKGEFGAFPVRVVLCTVGVVMLLGGGRRRRLVVAGAVMQAHPQVYCAAAVIGCHLPPTWPFRVWPSAASLPPTRAFQWLTDGRPNSRVDGSLSSSSP